MTTPRERLLAEIPLDVLRDTERMLEHLSRQSHLQRSRASHNVRFRADLEETFRSKGISIDALTSADVDRVFFTSGFFDLSGVEPDNRQKTRVLSELEYCRVKSKHHQDPIWVLDEDCARALAETDPPVDRFTTEVIQDRLKLPFPCLFLSMPPIFSLRDETGDHAIEGIYLAEDRASLDALHPDGVPTILFVGVGRCNGTYRLSDGSLELDDCLRSFLLGAGISLEFLGEESDALSIARLGVNFLLALHSGYLQTETVRPIVPKNATKRDKRERRGEMFEPHTVVRLGAKARRAQRASLHEGTGSKVTHRAHLVRGHWHAYWVSDREGHVSLEEKEGKHGTLHRIAKWIFPFVRGEGEVKNPKYKVRGGAGTSLPRGRG